MHRFLSSVLLRLIVGIALAISLNMSHAGVGEIALVLSEDSAPYQEFAARFRSALLAGQGASPRVSVLLAGKPNIANTDLIVTVGLRATQSVLDGSPGAPVLATLIPRSAYAQLKKEVAREREFSAIYLDQPFSRQLALVREMLPDRKRPGVLLGPTSSSELRAIQAAARERGLLLASERISDEDDLLSALKRLLTDADVLLAVPDPLVFNRHSLQSILLTSYRAQDPMIAFSQSYVAAGALAAVYSSPAQIAQQSAELVLRLGTSAGMALPSPQYPRYFTVGLNAQVARSMGIAIEDEAVLHKRLQAGERE